MPTSGHAETKSFARIKHHRICKMLLGAEIPFQSRGNIDAVAENIAFLDDDIADVKAP
jgi:hypothetical protein